MALCDYRLEELEPGMHVKIPHQECFGSWADHLREDRWWVISKIDKDNFYIEGDGHNFIYNAGWVSEVRELNRTDFIPADANSFRDLFGMLLSN